ncbi:MAG: ABC transporter substrate-binding protein [Anaerolineae bacterium]|nr:ABC transporter substrate-binding protein [Anaerolineae bacterium]
MFKRVGALILFMALAAGSLSPAIGTTQAQAEGEIVVLGIEAGRAVVEAWTTAYSETHDGASFSLAFVESDDDVLTQAAEADIIFYAGFDGVPPVLECGTLSRAYATLPELGMRTINSTGCDDAAPAPDMLDDFAGYVVSPDGQQIAIDLGALPDVVEVVDQAGETVTISQPVRRVVSAYGISTYYVYTVGAGGQLVAAAYLGVGSPDTQEKMRAIDPNYDALTGATSLSQKEANVEEIAALEPDLILASARTQWLDAAAELGVPILRFEGETLERFQEAMMLIGTALGPNAAYRARSFNDYYNMTLEQIVAQTGGIEERTKVYFSGTEPLRVASGDMYQTAMVEAAGGVSVSKDLVGYWNDINLEQVVIWEPDVIFVPTYGGASVEAFTGSDEWAIVGAVQDGAVYMLPKLVAPWDTPLPDSILGIIWMAETLYPEQVELGCEDQAVYFYDMFYDYDLSPEEAQGLCK